MATVYEIRTTRNRPAVQFDTEHRAREFLADHPHARGWKLYRITRQEEELAA